MSQKARSKRSVRAGHGERALIERLARRLVAPKRGVEIGIGDDAAVIRSDGVRWVLSADASVEGVHFERRWLGLADVGYRSMMAALSDLGAMGAVPVAALSCLILDARTRDADVLALARGQQAAAQQAGVAIVGGNISSGSELSVTTSVCGRMPGGAKPLERSGARPSNEVWLIGDLGLARAGLELLRRGVAARKGRDAARARCVRAWRRPDVPLARGPQLLGRASAAMDVSDGLIGDATALARASGVTIVLERDALARAMSRDLSSVASILGWSPLDLALEGGEDYALIAAGPSRRRPPWAKRIGRVERGRPQCRLEEPDGRSKPLTGGYQHR
ncbi:MAG TPA: thiamine-phosphate kinase [Polyangiaceae bacterium]|jgi:thiamine-monophosphate kinase